MVSANSTEPDHLIKLVEVFKKLISSKWMIIQVVAFDLDSVVPGKILKCMFTSKCVSNSEEIW
jgi:hypothetical protein